MHQPLRTGARRGGRFVVGLPVAALLLSSPMNASAAPLATENGVTLIGSVSWWNAQPHTLPNPRRHPGTACPKGFDVMLVGGRVVPNPTASPTTNPYKVEYNPKRVVRVGWAAGGTRRVREGLPLCVRPQVPNITSPQQASTLAFAPPEAMARSVLVGQPVASACVPAAMPQSVAITAVTKEPVRTGQRIGIDSRTIEVGMVSPSVGIYSATVTVVGGSGVFATTGADRESATEFRSADLSVPLIDNASKSIQYWLPYPADILAGLPGPLSLTQPQGGYVSPDCGQLSVPEAYRMSWKLPVIGYYEVQMFAVTRPTGEVRVGFSTSPAADSLTPRFVPVG